MAFEKISDYTEKIRQLILTAKRIGETHEDKGTRLRAFAKESDLFEALVVYHDTVLQTAKFKGQRQHCRKVLEELNPSYCKGYFK